MIKILIHVGGNAIQMRSWTLRKISWWLPGERSVRFLIGRYCSIYAQNVRKCLYFTVQGSVTSWGSFLSLTMPVTGSNLNCSLHIQLWFNITVAICSEQALVPMKIVFIWTYQSLMTIGDQYRLERKKVRTLLSLFVVNVIWNKYQDSVFQITA